MGNYSKLIGGIIGAVVAMLMAWAASKGLGTCVPPITPDGEEVCTVWGFTTGQVTGAIMLVVTNAFVFFFPANKPS